jgi:hypothetical protein
MSKQPVPSKQPKVYKYVRIFIKNAAGRHSTISLLPDDHERLLKLARGSSATPQARVTDVCRRAAAELFKAKFQGKLSLAVYTKALRKLKGSFDPAVAAEYDAAQLPDGVPSQA